MEVHQAISHQLLKDTQIGQDGHPLYRRRKLSDVGFTAKLKVRNNSEVDIDNRWIVPQCPLLSSYSMPTSMLNYVIPFAQSSMSANMSIRDQMLPCMVSKKSILIMKSQSTKWDITSALMRPSGESLASPSINATLPSSTSAFILKIGNLTTSLQPMLFNRRCP